MTDTQKIQETQEEKEVKAQQEYDEGVEKESKEQEKQETKDDIELNIVKDLFGMNEDQSEETVEDTTEEFVDNTGETQEEERVSKVLADATRREKQMALKEKELNERAKQLDEWNSEKELLDTDVFSFLDKHGYDLGSLAEEALKYDSGDTPVDPVKVLTEKVAKLEKDKEISEARALHRSEKELLNSFKGEINDFFEQNQQEYPLTMRTDNTSLVYDYMVHVASETGEIPSIDEVAAELEETLQEQAKALQDIEPEEKDQEQRDVERLVKRKPKTLTNKKSKTIKRNPGRDLTQEQRDQEAEDIIKKMFF